MEKLVVSIDVGTSSVRVLVFDSNGEMLPNVGVQIYYQPKTTLDGGVELNADDLLAKTLQAMNDIVVQLGDQANFICAVSICSFWHSVLGVDKLNNVITPILLWADSRCFREANELRKTVNEQNYHARTGCFLHPSYLPAKLLWFRRSFPETVTQVLRWLSFGEYLQLKLLGKTVCSFSMASGSGLFNHQTMDWDEEILNAIGISKDKFSPLSDFKALDTSNLTSYVPKPFHRAQWFPALGDGACNNIGAGAVAPDTIALMVGTTVAMRVMASELKMQLPFGLWRYCVDLKRQLVGGAQSNGGIVIKWLTETLKLPSNWEEQIEQMPPDEHGLTVLPFLLTERSPEWDVDISSAILGFRLHHNPLSILKAFMESIALRASIMHKLLKQAFPFTQRIIATGGALIRSRVWARMFSDVLGQPITVCLEPEASARGGALMALEALGLQKSLADVTARLGETLYPDLKRHQRYLFALERQIELYETVCGGICRGLQ